METFARASVPDDPRPAANGEAAEVPAHEVTMAQAAAPDPDPDQSLPRRSYAILAGVYGLTVGGFALYLRRSGRRLPARVRPDDIALLGVATFKLSRLLGRAKVTSFLRAPVARYKEPAKGGEVQEEPRGEGVRRAIGELVTCPFCFSQWIATGLTFSYVLAPRATRLATATLTAVAVADAVQYGHTALQKTD